MSFQDGIYEKLRYDKSAYGTMILVRVTIVEIILGVILQKAITIAVRYSAIRRQSELRPG